MNSSRKTVYNVYASFSDAMKLYRSAMKKGYSHATIEPLADDDPDMKVITSGKHTMTVGYETITRPLYRRLSYKPGRGEYLGKYAFPTVMVYRNYAERTLLKPDFELYKVTLTREY